MRPPCKLPNGADCPKRSLEPNCHGYCEEYIQWVEFGHEQRRRERAERAIETVLYEQPKRIIQCSRERSRERKA